MVLPGTDTSTISHLPVEIIEADITKPETLNAACENITHIFHLAAIASDWAPKNIFTEVNEKGTENLLKAAMDKEVKRFIHTSSLATHKLKNYASADENTSLDATINYYAISKKNAEKIVNDFQQTGEIETVIIRPGFFPFGPGDMTSFFHLAKAIQKGKFGYVNSGKSKICTAYVKNLVKGMALAGFHTKAAGETFIICDDEPVSWRQIGEDMAKLLGTKKPWLSLRYELLFPIAVSMEMIWKIFSLKNSPTLTRYRISVPRYDLVFTNEKAKKLLGYEPKTNWEEGVTETIEWYKKVNQAADTE